MRFIGALLKFASLILASHALSTRQDYYLDGLLLLWCPVVVEEGPHDNYPVCRTGLSV